MKLIIILIIAIIVFIAMMIGFSGSGIQNENNVSIVDGKQIITIIAKGGYAPRITQAQANMPTVLNITTKSTFDCSSAIVIPQLNYPKNLSPMGTVSLNVPAQETNSTIRGTCAMGMYNFEIKFI